MGASMERSITKLKNSLPVKDKAGVSLVDHPATFQLNRNTHQSVIIDAELSLGSCSDDDVVRGEEAQTIKSTNEIPDADLDVLPLPSLDILPHPKILNNVLWGHRGKRCG